MPADDVCADAVSGSVVDQVQAFCRRHRPGLKLPDGWFGRPFDNQHVLTAAREADDGLLLELDGRLRMMLRGPVEVVVDPGRRLELTGFTSLSWERQDYGSSGRAHRTEYGPGTIELVVPAG